LGGSADPETDFVSPISERIGSFTEADTTERAKRCVIEALGARKIADPAPRWGYYRVEAAWKDQMVVSRARF
jgi:hypothetical protein